MKKIKASSLFFSLVFTMILTLSITLLMMLFLHFDNQNIRLNSKKDLLLNLSSAIEVVANYSNEFPINTEIRLDLFSEGRDSVTILRRKHGALDIVSITTYRSNQFERVVFDLGWRSINKPKSLYLADNSFPLSVCGNTIIEGKAFIPNKQIKRAYIEGKNYHGDKLIYGEIATSKRTVPPLDAKFYSSVLQQTVIDFSKDSIVSSLALKEKSNSFYSKRWVIKSDDFLKFQGESFQGNLTVISATGIYIGRNTNFVDVVFIAPRIYLEDYVVGQFQCIAFDSLMVGKNVILKYPSNLLLLESSLNSMKRLVVGKSSIIEGTIIIVPKNASSLIVKGSLLSIEKNVQISGQVYSPYRIKVSSNISINGSLYCKEVELKTPSAVYTNHFLDFRITPSKLEKSFVQTVKLPSFGTNKIIKWLN